MQLSDLPSCSNRVLFLMVHFNERINYLGGNTILETYLYDWTSYHMLLSRTSDQEEGPCEHSCANSLIWQMMIWCGFALKPVTFLESKLLSPEMSIKLWHSWREHWEENSLCMVLGKGGSYSRDQVAFKKSSVLVQLIYMTYSALCTYKSRNHSIHLLHAVFDIKLIL